MVPVVYRGPPCIFSKLYPWMFDKFNYLLSFKILAGANFLVLGLSAICFVDKSVTDDQRSSISPELEKRKSFLSHDSSTNDQPIKLNFINIITNKMILLLLIGDFLSWTAQFVPYVHLDKIGSNTSNDASGSNLVSYFGLFSAIGKIFFGYICTDHFKFWRKSSLQTYILAQIFFGLFVGFMPFSTSGYLLTILTISASISSGCYGLIQMFTKLLILNEKLYVTINGYLLVAEAIGTYIGPPIVGLLYDKFSNYTIGFVYSGVLLILSGVILIGLVKIEKENLRLVQ